MPTDEETDLAAEGIREAKAENTVMALMALEKAIARRRTPEVCAWLGYCLARERRAFAKALELCREGLEADPRNPEMFLVLGKIYLAAGRRPQALHVLRKGLKLGRNEGIMQTLQHMGVRKDPVFPFLSRGNAINVYSGLVLHRLGLR